MSDFIVTDRKKSVLGWAGIELTFFTVASKGCGLVLEAVL